MRRAVDPGDRLRARHPDVAPGRDRLAMLHHLEGRYAKVEPHYRRSLAIHETVAICGAQQSRKDL